jgi:hypothetical protein
MTNKTEQATNLHDKATAATGGTEVKSKEKVVTESQDFILPEATESYSEFFASLKAEDEDDGLPAILPQERNSGGSRWKPNVDPTRAVVNYPLLKRPYLRVSRKGGKSDDVLTISEHDFLMGTGKNLGSLQNRKQVTFVGTDNKTRLIGYVQIGKNGAKLCFPIKYQQEGFTPPDPRCKRPMRFKSIIFG